MGFNYTAVDQTAEVTRRRALDGECYVAALERRIVGTATLGVATAMTRPPPYARPGLAYLTQFAVEPGLQGRGLGSRILAHVEARARDLGADTIALDTAEGAERLVRFYAARGYLVLGHLRWPDKSYRSVILGKPLTRKTGP
jgi:GNAT superfamily N-acetyltransferase